MLAKLYVKDWETMKAENTGYLFWGAVGTGKSFLAGCIANALLEQEIEVRMNNFAEVLNDLSANFSEKNTYIKNLCRVPLLILDDFGMERGTEYGLEIESEPDEGTTVRIHLPKTEEASSVEKGDRQ